MKLFYSIVEIISKDSIIICYNGVIGQPKLVFVALDKLKYELKPLSIKYVPALLW